MKIAIMGSGGIGGYYGGRLAKAGESVTFIARGAHLEALQTRGLQVYSHFGDFRLPQVEATSDAGQIGTVELVIMAVKAYQLEEAAEAIRPLIGPETVVLPLLNGVDIPQRIAAVVGEAPVLSGLCGLSTSLAEPGVIRQTTAFEYLYFGEISGERTPRAQAVEAVLTGAEINAKLSAEIEREVWNKFILLAASAGVCSLLRSTKGPIWADPDTRSLLEQTVREVEAVARALGVRLNADDGAAKALAQIENMPDTMKPSMALDLELGRPLELEALNGTVVRLGAQLGVDTPVNRFIYTALKLHAQGAA